MKTIGFYSYKGGTGKSLMAANLAACLSRLGKHCVVVDCDVEGPSVHNKFGRAGKGATGRGGLIGLIAEHFEEKDWEASDVDNASPTEVDDVERFLYELPAAWDPTTETQHGPTGTIKLLPAGDIYGPDYWNVVWSPLWHGLFTVYHRYSIGQITSDRYRRILKFFLSIKAAIEGLSPAPDYMIVDFRAGSSELSTTLINAWIDTLVYAFSFNEDSIDYLDRTFAKIFHAGHDREESETPFDIELVLSRVPTSIEFRGDRMLWSALRAMRLGWDDIHILHSDRDIELAEEVRTGYQATPQNRRLTQDYMKLFESLLDPDDVADTGLASAIGLPEDLEEVDRIFSWESERGAIINPSDGSRNVSFKVETFQVLLQGLEHGLSKIDRFDQTSGDETSTSITEQSTEWIGDVLFTAGRRCGANFGDALAAGWHKSRDMGIEVKIRKWCEFDSDVGFGRFQLEPHTIEIKGQKLIHCDVYLRESFLTPAEDTLFKDAGDHRFCSLMTGYIQGVISRILGYEVEVAHDIVNPNVFSEHSISSGFRSESCLFAVSIKQETGRPNVQAPQVESNCQHE